MIKVDDLSAAIASSLAEYSTEVTEKMKKAVDKAAGDCNQAIKENIKFSQPTGKYVKAFRVKTSFEDKLNKRKTWYVANGQHRLTHLLEFGHAKTNGGRTRAFPHIKHGEDVATKNLEKYIKEEIEK